VKLRTVTALRDFDALAPVWEELTRASGQTSPFLSHDWFACCWRSAGPNRRREIWILEDSCGPVAFVPLLRERSRARGLPVRHLHLLGTPDTPFADLPLVGPPDAAIAAILDALHAASDWDVLSFGRLPAGSATMAALETAMAGRFPWRVAGDRLSPSLSVSGSGTDFALGQDPPFAQILLELGLRLEGQGPITVEEHTAVDAAGPIFGDLIDVSLRSSSARQGTAIASLQDTSRFYAELTGRASARGWLHLWLLRLDGRAVASEYQIGNDGSRYALRSEADSDHAESQPAAYLNLEVLRALSEARRPVAYTMLADPPAHLGRTPGRHRVVSLDVYAPTRYGRFLHGVETRLVPRARGLRPSRAERCA
jgi:CelD/BcsL family acetyltransferase involved in cellulose biosynthesis